MSTPARRLAAVHMRYAFRKGTEVRSATVQRDVSALGAGPNLP